MSIVESTEEALATSSEKLAEAATALYEAECLMAEVTAAHQTAAEEVRRIEAALAALRGDTPAVTEQVTAEPKRPQALGPYPDLTCGGCSGVGTMYLSGTPGLLTCGECQNQMVI